MKKDLELKKDLINVIIKYLLLKDIDTLYLNDTPFGKYNSIISILRSDLNCGEVYIVKENNKPILLNDLANTETEEYVMDLLLTIYDKIKETN